jgi:hypothetical protein
MAIKLPTIVKNPPGATCPDKCDGLLMRYTLSRLEEGLGHEGFECDRCRKRLKYVPQM